MLTPFFQVGDWVQAVVDGVVKAEGRVRRLREGGHWEYELESRPNVWFARTVGGPKRGGGVALSRAAAGLFGQLTVSDRGGKPPGPAVPSGTESQRYPECRGRNRPPW